METYEDFKTLIQRAIAELELDKKPAGLYDPVKYTLDLGGKRLRPVLTLAACDLFGCDVREALHPAIGVEIFHNFTLLHDDIMDRAPLRRGEPTVYQKWNSDVAILSGDTMFALAYRQFLLSSHPAISEILKVFTQTAIEVCEGQQYDMDFEDLPEVRIDDYINMIRLKTAVLLGGCLKIGAMIGNADDAQSQVLYDFGVNIGIAFQLKDDWLDAFGEKEKFGKSIGGDIIANKKTFLYLKCLEMANATDRKLLIRHYGTETDDHELKVMEILGLFRKYHIRETANHEMEKYFENARQLLKKVNAPGDRKNRLIAFAESLYKRDH